MIWTSEKDAVLRVFRKNHTWNWPGWAEVLPGFSVRQLKYRATMLRLPRPVPRGSERVVFLFACGRTPTEIDKMLGLEDGTAKRLVAELWAMRKEEP